MLVCKTEQPWQQHCFSSTATCQTKESGLQTAFLGSKAGRAQVSCDAPDLEIRLTWPCPIVTCSGGSSLPLSPAEKYSAPVPTWVAFNLGQQEEAGTSQTVNTQFHHGNWYVVPVLHSDTTSMQSACNQSACTHFVAHPNNPLTRSSPTPSTPPLLPSPPPSLT